MYFRMLLGLAYASPDCFSRRQEMTSGDQPPSRFFSTNFVRCPSVATLLQFFFFRYCFQYALRIAASAVYFFLPPFSFTSSVIVDLPRPRVFPISTNVSPTLHI